MRPNVTSEKVKVFQQTEWPKLDKLFSSKLLQHILAPDHHILQWTGKYKSRNKRKLFRFEFPSFSINLRQALKSIEILCTFVFMILICAVCVLDIFRFITQQFSFLLLHQKQSSETEKTNWWKWDYLCALPRLDSGSFFRIVYCSRVIKRSIILS